MQTTESEGLGGKRTEEGVKRVPKTPTGESSGARALKKSKNGQEEFDRVTPGQPFPEELELMSDGEHSRGKGVAESSE